MGKCISIDSLYKGGVQKIRIFTVESISQSIRNTLFIFLVTEYRHRFDYGESHRYFPASIPNIKAFILFLVKYPINLKVFMASVCQPTNKILKLWGNAFL